MVKINFFYSNQLQFNILNCPYNWKKLDNFLNKLERLFNKNKIYILNEIKRLTGIKWKQKSIDVWLFEGWKSSISYPLLLNTYEYNLDFCFFNLVHELIHNNLINFKELNIKDKIKGWDANELEAIVELITLNVFKNIYSEKKLKKMCKLSELDGSYKYIWIRVRELEKEIDFSKTTIIEWCKSKKYVISK
ncbi:MAG: hypothetical protein ABIH25_05185 [Candidatus Woesearchaeota archaeon]